MRRAFLICVVSLLMQCEFIGCGDQMAYAQAAPAAAVPAQPQLSATEQTAVAAIAEKMKAQQDEYQANQKKGRDLLELLHAVESDIRTQHAGLELDENTLSLVKIRPKPVVPAKK